MDLICYLYPGWAPRIRPAAATRPWMDALPEAFGYRCLPLTIANAQGWEILNVSGFEASWNGGGDVADVTIRLDGGPHDFAPVSLFGNGILTFHVAGLFRTPPGYDLWIGGSPNRFKDAIAPLTGIVETDWSPYTFTVNWRFTRPDHPVRFEADEPICFVFPMQRDLVEQFDPILVPLEEAPDVMAQFQAWSRSRNAFQAEVARDPPASPADKWQKRYYRGLDMEDRIAGNHRARVRLKPFAMGHPGRAASHAVDVDEARLAEALAGIARGLAAKTPPAELAALLVAIGFPEEIAERTIRAAREALASDAIKAR